MMLGNNIELVNSAKTNNSIIKIKKFCSPGIATNRPAESPAHVVAVVSKMVLPVLETVFTMPEGVSPSSFILSMI